MKNVISLMALICCFFIIQSCEKELNFSDEHWQDESSLPDHKLSRSCNMSLHMNKLLTDPEYKKQHEEKFLKLEREYKKIKNRINCDNPPIIPIAVHFQGANGANQSCLTDLAKEQIQILNKDFRGENDDISKWVDDASDAFPGIKYAEACFEFKLANKNHPGGYGLSDGDLAVTMNKTNGDFDANWSGYLNIYVQLGTGVLGYAPLGGSGNGDGVVIEGSAFGGGSSCGNILPQAPFDKGRTTTHEVGHYLLLDHIWGNGCSQDDGVADTPESEREYYDCPEIGVSSCGSKDLHMNYMDYVDDACMYMFSEGQAIRSENYIISSLGSLIDNAKNVIDGVNNEETDDSDDTDDTDNTDDSEDEEETTVDSNCDADPIDYYSGEYLTDDVCYLAVIAADDYCCGVEFDYLCQEAYDECVGYIDDGSCQVEAFDFETGEKLTDSECVELVQEFDTYCCETEWDRLCQYYYDGCVNYGYQMRDFKAEDAMVLVGENKLTGKIQITYSLRNWNPNTDLVIEVGDKVIYNQKVTNRRGTIEKDMKLYKNSGAKSIKLIQNYSQVAKIGF